MTDAHIEVLEGAMAQAQRETEARRAAMHAALDRVLDLRPEFERALDALLIQPLAHLPEAHRDVLLDILSEAESRLLRRRRP